MMTAATFVETILVNPETGTRFVLTDAERLFLEHAFEQMPDGRLRYPELVFSGPKKGNYIFNSLDIPARKRYNPCINRGLGQ